MSNLEHRKNKIPVFDKNMTYVEMGEGNKTILFLHGNPTSSYLWRNIMPYLQKQGRCLAPDLIGMGDSDKLDNNGPGTYTFVEHRKWLNELLDKLNIGNEVILVIHDWGSALGFDWANRNQARVSGIVYMEGIVRPLKWSEWPDSSAPIFKGFRSEAGEKMVIEKNIFVDKVLPGSVLRGLSDEEMAIYRRPFELNEDRRPTLDWPNQIPIDGSPHDVTEIVKDYSVFLSTSDLPKLFVNAEPGAILVGAQREFCRSWPNQKEITVPGSHFIQEDSADIIGKEISEWLRIINY